MNINTGFVHSIVVPVIYALIWVVGLSIGLYDLLPQVYSKIGYGLVVAYSVYCIFLMESLVFIIDLGITERDWDFILKPNMIMAFQIMVFVVIFLISGLLYIVSDTLSLWLIVLFMGLHKFVMAYFGNNVHRYLSGEVINTLQ